MKNRLITGLLFVLIGFTISDKIILPWLKAKPTIIWGDDWKPVNTPNASITHQYFILFTKPDGPRYEAGLRSDGVVVWREVK